jgi:hypothetical protein
VIFGVVGIGIIQGAGLTAALAYAGYRAGRGVAGLTGAYVTGKGGDELIERSTKKTEKEIYDEYLEGITPENVVEKSKKLNEDFLLLEQKKKRQKLYKALAQVTAGGAVAFAAGNFDSFIKPTTVHAAGPTDGGTSGKGAGAATEGGKVQVKVPVNPAEAPAAPAIEVKPLQTEVSSRGFIQTFEDMKKGLVEQYGDKIPKQYEHFVKTSPVKLAQEFGMYDPDVVNESGMGLKGESLVLDGKGNLIYQNIDGTKETLFEGGKQVSDFHKIGGEMFDSDPKPAVLTEQKTPDVPQEYDSETGDPVSGNYGASTASIDGTAPEYSVYPDPEDAPVTGVPSADGGDGGKLYDPKDFTSKVPTDPESSLSETMNHPEPSKITFNKNGDMFYEGKQYGWAVKIGKAEFFKPFDAFQEINSGSVSAMRRGFSQIIHEKLMDRSNGLGQVESIDFNNGKIHVIRGVGDNYNEAHVLLNGKEIARGTMEPGKTDIKFDKGLAGRWWQEDTVYEKAFKEAKKVIKGMAKGIEDLKPKK